MRGDPGHAAVVGSGPNGLAAAIVLAEAGWRVTVFEAHARPGGGTRSAELTLPGAIHDVCSAVHPFGVASPFFRRLGLERHGLRWIHPRAPLAHAMEGAPAVMLRHSLAETAAGLGRDGLAWERLMGPAAAGMDALLDDALSLPSRRPRRPAALASLGLRGAWPASALARALFREEPARALLAGMAAHAVLPLSHPLTAVFGVLLGAAGHARGWPVAEGGSEAIARALVARLRELGGEVVTERHIAHLAELDDAELVMLDVSPRAFLRLAAGRLPARYVRALTRFRHGPGAYKVDYALDGPIPWADPACADAATVHVGGTLADVAASERAVARGRHPERPFLIVAQQSLFDPSRVPSGTQVVWAYCHVPNGSHVGMGARIDAQIERAAPGFRARAVARHETAPADLERGNANYVGGDIGGGAMDGLQPFARPLLSLLPYRTPLPGVFLCSASTPPGGGVHGMCGVNAARTAIGAIGAIGAIRRAERSVAAPRG